MSRTFTTRMLFACALSCGVALLALSSLRAGGGAGARDAQRLQGQWSVTLLQEGEEKEPPEQIQDIVVQVKDDRFTFSKKEKVVLELSFKLDADKRPKAVDFTVLSGEDKGKVDVGIYAIEGDTVRFCTNEKNAKRPTDFATKLDGQPLNLVTLKRK